MVPGPPIPRLLVNFVFRYFFLFFFVNAKNLGRSDDAKRRKKEDGLIFTNNKISVI